MTGSTNGYGAIPQREDLEVEQSRQQHQNGHGSKGGARGVCPNFRTAWTAVGVGSALIVLGLILNHGRGGSPTRAIYFNEQLVDHHDPSAGVYKMKYFEQRKHFQGPGHPIFVILGGEDAMIDLLYPFIYENLGQRYGAYSMGVEHRFFGDSWPVPYDQQTNADLRKLLTPEQAILDVVRLIQFKQKEFGCGPRGDATYCPVMVVGGSYPGLMATLLRLRHSDVVDIGYAGSAPLYLYSHGVDSNAYYDKVTQVADVASPGCSDAVRSTLLDVQDYVRHSKDDVASIASTLGICQGSVPDYIDSHKLFAEELMMVIVTHFADDNMGFYPPIESNELVRSCYIFQNDKATPTERVSSFLRMRKGFEQCFDLMTELPPGPQGHISASDWSGVADGPAGWMWDFLSCVLIPECGMSSASMFPERPWTLEWFTNHCQRRFGYTPSPPALEEQFHFTELTNVTHLLFTNGVNDGWSVASVMVKPPHSDIEVINFPNGAHHSDLRVAGPTDYDTPDIKAGHATIADLIGTWLDEVRTSNTEEAK